MNEAPLEDSQQAKKFEVSLEVSNKMQSRLMEAYGNPMEWIELYAKEFRALIESDEGQHLYELYEKDISSFEDEAKKELQKRVLH